MDSSTSETLSISPPPSSQNKISQPRRSIPFINYDPKKGFMISKDAEDFLASLNPDRKIGVISIVGKYRTGKSFFINRVLLNIKGDGFNVGSTVNACTKGIWIWNDVILPDVDSEHKDMDILVLDTEGFGDTEENTTHDSRIFLFSLLLCSFFIYNSVGNIDENALNGVSLIVNLAKGIQVKSAKGADQEEDPALYFPSFLWVVRDFALLLTDKGGVTIKDKEYLEKALDHQKGVSDGIESKNRLRRLFKHFFKDRDCCTLIRPMESETELQKINDKEDFEFREEFVEQLKVIRKKILKKVNPKVLNGKTFNGEMLLELTRVYIKTMNSGSLPNIDNAWQYLMKSESKKAMTSNRSFRFINQSLYVYISVIFILFIYDYRNSNLYIFIKKVL